MYDESLWEQPKRDVTIESLIKSCSVVISVILIWHTSDSQQKSLTLATLNLLNRGYTLNTIKKNKKNEYFFFALSVSLPFKKLYNSFRSSSKTNNNATSAAVSSLLVSAIQRRNAVAHNRISVNQCATVWYCMLHNTCCLLFWGFQVTYYIIL